MRVAVIDGGVHIIVGPNNRCECGIDETNKRRSCIDILQELVDRNGCYYRDGKVPYKPAPHRHD